MSKKLPTEGITNELARSVFFQKAAGEQPHAKPQANPKRMLPHSPAPTLLEEPPKAEEYKTERAESQPGHQQLPNPSSATRPPINQWVNSSINRLMNKPTGFYITEQLDTRLDGAVDYFRRQHGLKKVDRSILLNALLEDDTLWQEASLNQLIERLIRLLTNRLIG